MCYMTVLRSPTNWNFFVFVSRFPCPETPLIPVDSERVSHSLTGLIQCDSSYAYIGIQRSSYCWIWILPKCATVRAEPAHQLHNYKYVVNSSPESHPSTFRAPSPNSQLCISQNQNSSMHFSVIVVSTLALMVNNVIAVPAPTPTPAIPKRQEHACWTSCSKEAFECPKPFVSLTFVS